MNFKCLFKHKWLYSDFRCTIWDALKVYDKETKIKCYTKRKCLRCNLVQENEPRRYFDDEITQDWNTIEENDYFGNENS